MFLTVYNRSSLARHVKNKITAYAWKNLVFKGIAQHSAANEGQGLLQAFMTWFVGEKQNDRH